MEYKIGDKVRFVTLDPRWSAEYTTGEMRVENVYEDGACLVSYDGEPRWFTQTVHPDDVEHV